MSKKTIAVSLLSALLITACGDDKGATQKQDKAASKDATAQKIDKAFAKRDADNDGQISRKEFVQFAVAAAESKPPKIDANSDGTVAMGEYKASMAKLIEKLKSEGVDGKEINDRIAKGFAKYDDNKDGSVSTAEYAKRKAGMQFKKKDSNEDKQLSQEEFLAKSGEQDDDE